MKRKTRRVVNFFAFNLLFFALYLNFIHKDKPAAIPTAGMQNAAAYQVSSPVHNLQNEIVPNTGAVVNAQ
jgi:hypothetical protein